MRATEPATRSKMMSLPPRPLAPIPEETIRVARSAFPKGNRYMQMRDELGSIYTDEMFADLYPNDGQPAVIFIVSTRAQLKIAAQVDGVQYLNTFSQKYRRHSRGSPEQHDRSAGRICQGRTDGRVDPIDDDRSRSPKQDITGMKIAMT